MLRFPLQVLKLMALLLRPQQSPATAHLLHLFLYLFLHLLLPPCLQIAVTVSLLQKRPSSVSPVQVQMLWHPWVQACPRFGSSRAMHCGSLMN